MDEDVRAALAAVQAAADHATTAAAAARSRADAALAATSLTQAQVDSAMALVGRIKDAVAGAGLGRDLDVLAGLVVAALADDESDEGAA